MKRDFGIFQVGLKILLKKGNKMLVLRTDDGYVDLPGGRIDNVEYESPVEKTIAREIREELGSVRYTLGRPLFTYRRYSPKCKARIFVLVYEADYVSGTIRLSDEHIFHEWIGIGTFPFTGKDFVDEEIHRLFKKHFKTIS